MKKDIGKLRDESITFAKTKIAKNGKIRQADFSVKNGAPCCVETVIKIFDGWHNFKEIVKG